jgi:hypothetical protein
MSRPALVAWATVGAMLTPLWCLAAEPATAIAATVNMPCPVGSAHRAEAQAMLAALAAQMKTLDVASDPGAAAASMTALFAHRCFSFIPKRRRSMDAAQSALSLKTFWEDGARAWFEAGLALADPEVKRRRFWVLPGVRNTLAHTPTHPLASLLCAPRDAACGQETEGWTLRADRSMRDFAAAKRAKARRKASVGEKTALDPSECAPPEGKSMDFHAWAECVASTTPRSQVLPLGRLRAPSTGWLVIAGRRGHYQFCDEIRAYDLETGAAYIAASCGGLQLSPKAVDHDGTNARRRFGVRMGRLSRDNLREAAWMILLWKQVGKPIVRFGHAVVIPPHLKAEASPVRSTTVDFGSTTVSSAQTALRWHLTAEGAALGQGRLNWPLDYDDAAAQHAVFSLRVAEAAFVEGCVPARLPHTLSAPPGRGGVSRVDARPGDLDAVQQTLWSALMTAEGTLCGSADSP